MTTTHILTYGLLLAVALGGLTYALASGQLGGRSTAQPVPEGNSGIRTPEQEDAERRRQRKADKKRRRDQERVVEERRREAQRAVDRVQNDPVSHLTWVFRRQHASDAANAARGLDEATRADARAQTAVDDHLNEEFSGRRPTSSQVLQHQGFAAGWGLSTIIAVALDYILFKEVLHDQLTLLGAGISLVSTILIAYLIDHARRTWRVVEARRRAALLFAAAVFATATWGTVLVILGVARGEAMNDDAIAKDKANISAIQSDSSLTSTPAGQLALKNADEALSRAETAKSTQTTILTLAAIAATAGDILLWPNLGWIAAAERLKRLDEDKRSTAAALDLAKGTVTETQNRVVAGLTDELHRNLVPINDDLIRQAAGAPTTGQAAEDPEVAIPPDMSAAEDQTQDPAANDAAAPNEDVPIEPADVDDLAGNRPEPPGPDGPGLPPGAQPGRGVSFDE